MSPGRFSRKSLALLVLVLVAGLLLATRPDRSAPPAEPVPLAVAVTEVAQRDLQPTEAVTGRLLPARRVTLRNQVAGTVRERPVVAGQPVAAGSPLLVLDDADYRDALVEARAALELERESGARDRELLALARRNLELQEAEVRRQESLVGRSLVAQSRLDQARAQAVQLASEVARLEAAVAASETRVRLQQARLQRAERDLARTRITAPFDGQVNHFLVEPGDYLAVNTAVADFVDVAELNLRIDVRGAVARGLALGQAVAVTVNGRGASGRVHSLQTDPDERTLTHAVEIRLPGGVARPGDWARAVLPLAALDDALVVPVTAVLREEGRAFLFEVDAGRVRRVEVTTGPRVGDLQVIEQGVAAGTPVVARDVAALADGLPVTPLAPDA